MFKFVVVFACIAALAVAAPVKEEKEIIEILKSEITKNDNGSYQLAYESADGSIREEKATVVDEGTDEEALEIKGSYKYINDAGEEVEVFYTAGKNGFVPYGSIINPEITAVAEAAKDLPKYENEYAKKSE
ncbi:larval cuticle protein 65Ag1-like [Musca vetustissima]|uniref:larval cuticle protein 65Ag1-like n=1 Tax=Musca vetustissima TaxID=27455 RepID=UPI002AB61265|nr:larval cuticle protein 65Ag1-like [Musca vetustissima]